VRPRKILIMGLPGAGKTTLARLLAAKLNAVFFNADQVRTHLNKDLGFSLADRIEQARRLGWLCDQVTMTGAYVIADFVCPTPETRSAFRAGGDTFVIWVDRIASGRFEDTNDLFVAPDQVDLRITQEGTAEDWCERIVPLLSPTFNPRRPTALFLGRYQPFQDRHKALVIEGIRRVGQACIAVRDAVGSTRKSPFPFDQVKSRIEHALKDYDGRFVVVSVPNISNIFYGGDAGFSVGRIRLDQRHERLRRHSVKQEMPSHTIRPDAHE